jgi:hypothetical protein
MKVTDKLGLRQQWKKEIEAQEFRYERDMCARV